MTILLTHTAMIISRRLKISVIPGVGELHPTYLSKIIYG
jgi:hypothetical protein